jgi:hypothetical protein
MGGAQAVMEIAAMFVEVMAMRGVMGVGMIVVGMTVDRAVRMGVLMSVSVRVVVAMFVALDCGFAFAASAYRAHCFFSEKESAVFSFQSSAKPGVLTAD